jgi:hypothetical protein
MGVCENQMMKAPLLPSPAAAVVLALVCTSPELAALAALAALATARSQEPPLNRHL